MNIGVRLADKVIASENEQRKPFPTKFQLPEATAAKKMTLHQES